MRDEEKEIKETKEINQSKDQKYKNLPDNGQF